MAKLSVSLDAGVLFHLEELPENPLFRVVGARGITRRRPDAAVFFTNQIFGREIFIFAITPLLADALMEEFGEGLRQAVREGFRHDGIVIVMVGLEFPDQFLESVAAGDGKGANVIDRCWSPMVECRFSAR